MNKQYFIDITTYQTMNKLDEQLQRVLLDEFQHRLIDQDNIPLIKESFNRVCTEYKNAGGRAVVAFQDFLSHTSDRHMKAQVCKGDRTSMYIDLTATRGKVL